MNGRLRNLKNVFSLSGLTGWLFAGIPLLLMCSAAAGGLGAALAAYLFFSKDLPAIPDLRKYKPKTVSTFYADDGTVIGIFYKEKRFPVPLRSVPPHVINAFLAAEDVRFFTHPGVDWMGIVRAAFANLENWEFSQGGSTITQQVTRNFLLTRKKKVSRKIKEALLSVRLEKTLTKEEILELYLNEIFLGKGAYGVESAARTYFGKRTQGLTIAEAALLAGLVPGPSRFNPYANMEKAMERRSTVLANMLRYGLITPEQYKTAQAEKPRLRENLPSPYERAPYFTEAVRQYIADKYGDERLYNDGLKVWTTCDLRLQDKGTEALRSGAEAWEKRQRRPKGLRAELSREEAQALLNRKAGDPPAVGEVIRAVVLKNTRPKKKKRKKGEPEEPIFQTCELGLPGNQRFRMKIRSDIPYHYGDLLEFKVTSKDGTSIALEHVDDPLLQGALVCIENHTGYVKALVGGTNFERSRFNRAVQAKRQPGSAFKPFVYSGAFEWAFYSPNSMVTDEPIAVVVNPEEPEWVPMNSDREYVGPMSLMDALKHSRNTASVKLLMDVGIDPVIELAYNMGIESPLGRNLSLALGASEVTPLELTAAYSVFPNMGTRVQPVLVKKVVDRFGNVLEDNTTKPLEVNADTIADQKAVEWLRNRAAAQMPQPRDPFFAEEDAPAFEEHHEDVVRRMRQATAPSEPEPRQSVLDRIMRLPSLLKRKTTEKRPEPTRVLSPQTAYLVTGMLRQICVSGTGAKASKLGRRDIAGKTGTTDNCTDAWFMGFNPTYTTGVWVGFDEQASLGKKEYGSKAALPVWMDFMKAALKDAPETGYPPPPGIVFWSGHGPGTSDRLRLLESGPDLAPEIARKQVCPVDVAFMPSAGYQYSAYYGQGGYGSQFNPSYQMYGQQGPYAINEKGELMAGVIQGSVRVLTAGGEDLGHAYWSVDEEGEIIVHRDTATTEYRTPGDVNGGGPYYQEGFEENQRARRGPIDSFMSGAAQALNDLHNVIPGGDPFEWSQ